MSLWASACEMGSQPRRIGTSTVTVCGSLVLVTSLLARCVLPVCSSVGERMKWLRGLVRPFDCVPASVASPPHPCTCCTPGSRAVRPLVFSRRFGFCSDCPECSEGCSARCASSPYSWVQKCSWDVCAGCAACPQPAVASYHSRCDSWCDSETYTVRASSPDQLACLATRRSGPFVHVHVHTHLRIYGWVY